MNLSDKQKAMLLILAAPRAVKEFKWGSDQSNVAGSLVGHDLVALSDGAWGYYVYRLTDAGKREALTIAKQVTGQAP